jgi:hypothetical protein
MARKPKTTRAAAKPADETPVEAVLAEEAAAPDEAPEDSEVFEFAEGDEALPWLEGDDDTDEGPDTARLVGFALIGLILLAAIVGGIWYASRDRTDPELLADGSVIEAPAEPFKERPEDPGGKVHEGTGDTSFAVAEGQTRESRVDDAPVTTPAARPSIDREQAPKPDRAATGGVGVQVAAYSDRASAEKGWAQLTRQYSALSGFKHRVVEGKADIGTVYRLQAVAANVSAADELCSTLRRAGAACQVKN